MLSEREALELEILRLIAKTEEPVGSGSICKGLRNAGFRVSEATVGRLLRDMDDQLWTQRCGYQGRILTEAGKERRDALAADTVRYGYEHDLKQALLAHTRDELMDILVARRAIEREIARLAALMATEEDLAEIKTAMDARDAQEDEGVVAYDAQFHKLIAQASHNKVLAAAINLIRQDATLSPVLEHIRRQVKSTLYVDHQNIFQGIYNRDPVAAEAAMTEHIENLIADVKKYWNETHADKPEG